ncbi:hypothetical protein [Phascolarctobacterium faecium]|jgi:hypothetical protein|uniref:hypothetical protein n=1 Tax=Phascolarctobacterium faecium TaxID=33025 RepID=UPI001032B7FC|nr:hypothetical protein [Phascolarctobacterium faecium]DAM41389.1 MAG TPA: Protein of unknown function (DUF3489) [Caudoviricetes sp.]
MGFQENLQDILKTNEKKTFKEICETVDLNPQSVHHMFKRQSVRCDIAEKLLAVIGKELQIVDKKDE